MPLIPDHELLAIKQQTDLVSLVGERGVGLRRSGKDWIGLCPHHDDTEPSLVVSPEKGLWRCLGACNEGGSAIDWVMRDQGVGFREAVEILQRRLASDNGSSSRENQAATSTEVDHDLLARVWQVYRETYEHSAQAQEYAKNRLLDDAQALERFGLGFADRTLAERLAIGGSQEGQQLRESLKRLGVFRETGHEHLAGCLVFAIHDQAGAIVNLYGRKIHDTPTSPKHLYLPGPRRGLWNPEGLEGAAEIVLCESLIDAWTFWCAGFRYVTASWGTNGFTEDHLDALKRHGIERVLIAYDADRAGNEAARKLAEQLGGEGYGCWLVCFPKGMDANEYAQKVKPASKALRTALDSAEWMSGPKKSPRLRDQDQRLKEEKGTGSPPQPSLEPSSPLAASSSPDPATSQPKSGAPVDVAFGDRRWRVRSWEKNLSYEKLSVLIRVSTGNAFFVDTVDLVQAKQRTSFLRTASAELEVDEKILKKDLSKVHLQIEELQDRLIQQELSPQDEEPERMTPQAERNALDHLRHPDLLDRLLEDFEHCGIVGERINKLVAYLATISRKLERPLAILIQSSSAAGKSSLMEAVLAFVPEEDRVQYSAMTGQSLFYLGETDLQHKVLAIVEEEGAERASYALKLLQSEGELTIASTGKDPNTGKLLTHEYRVEGPVMLFLTTTSIEIDEELLNRCLVLTVDESRQQTRAIHQQQRERRTLEGMLQRRKRSQVRELHRNAQRLLRALPVVNPYASQLTFLDTQTRTRRDHEKYLTLIEAITLLHQHQRPKKRATTPSGEVVEYLEVTLSDIETANRLAGAILGQSLDELPPQTRRFLQDLDQMVGRSCDRQAIDRDDFRFTRRQVCEATGWSLTQVRAHLERLIEHEYVLVHRGRKGQRFVYELLWQGEGIDGSHFLSQLIDVENLQEAASSERYVSNLAAQRPGVAASEVHLAGSKRPQNGGMAAGWRSADPLLEEAQMPADTTPADA